MVFRLLIESKLGQFRFENGKFSSSDRISSHGVFNGDGQVASDVSINIYCHIWYVVNRLKIS